MNGIAARAIGLVLFASVAGAQQNAPGTPVSAAARTIAERFSAAASFEQFVGSDTTRQAEWKQNYEMAASSVAAIIPRVRAVGGRWRLLVVAESWCNDAVNSVPYLARLAAEYPAVEIRLLRKADAPDLFEGHLLDGRAATPLVLLYDQQFVERGAWIERPAALQKLITSKEGRVCEETLKGAVRSWRLADNGRSVLDEVVALIEGAAAASPISTTR